MRHALKALLCAGAATAVLATGTALAQQNWPNRPITYIVPFSPGGATDVIGRIYSQGLGPRLGQTVVVENRPGTGGSLGSAVAARAAADGYTLVGGTISSHSINVSIYPSIGYDPIKDFTPVILTGTLPNVLVVPAKSDLKTVEDVIKRAKSRPEALTVGSSGVGSSQHMAAELFASMIDAKLLHVPYKGSSQSLQAMLGGEIDILFDNATSAIPFIQSGQLRALAVTSTEETDALPGIKPLQDYGLKGYDVVSWQATFAPAGTPPDIVQRLHKEMAAVLKEPDVQARFKTLGLTVSGAGPEELAKFQQEEVRKWADVAKRANIKVD